VNARACGDVSVWRLIRFDKAVDQWYIAQLVAVFFGLFLHSFPNPDSFMTWEPGRRPVPFDLFYLLAALFFVFIVVMTGVRTKSEPIYMTMPIPARRIWLSRVMSMLGVSQLSIALMTLAAAVRVPGGGEPVFIDLLILRLGLHTGASMALLLMLLQLPFIELARVVSTVSYVAYAIFISAVTVFATIVTIGVPWSSSIFLLAAVLTALWILMHVPSSFSLMPAEPGRNGPDGASESVARNAAAVDAEERVRAGEEAVPAISPAPTPMKRNILIARILVNKWSYWLDCLMLVFYSLMAVSAYYNGSRDNPWWLFGFIWIFAALFQSLPMLRRIDFLPLSRVRLFAMTMVPIGVSILLGMGIGYLGVTLQPHEQRLIGFYDSRVQIPKEFYELTEDGPPPVLTSIWGEFHEPEAYPLYKGSSRWIYRPFDTGPGSSPEFIALQIDRAAEAIHGIERDPLERYEDLDEEFIGAVQGCCFKVMKSIGRSSDTRSRVYALAGILSALFYSVIIALQMRYGGRYGAKHISNFIVPGAVIILMAIIVTVVLGGRAGLCKPSFVEAVPSIYMRRIADAVPFATGVLWSLFIAACAAGYLVMQSAYRRFEAPLAQGQKKKRA
jgi:hypothetical protein